MAASFLGVYMPSRVVADLEAGKTLEGQEGLYRELWEAQAKYYQ